MVRFRGYGRTLRAKRAASEASCVRMKEVRVLASMPLTELLRCSTIFTSTIHTYPSLPQVWRRSAACRNYWLSVFVFTFLIEQTLTPHRPPFQGPWAYRIGTLLIMFPIYPILLLTFGTLGRRHVYFRHFAVKMLSRFGIPKGKLDPWYRGKSVEQIKKMEESFRKW